MDELPVTRSISNDSFAARSIKVFHQLLQAGEVVDLVDLVVVRLQAGQGGQAGHQAAQGGQPGWVRGQRLGQRGS